MPNDTPAHKRETKESVAEKIASQHEAAKNLAKRLGHAAVICRNGSTFFVHDSWQEVKRPAVALMFVSADGTSMKVQGGK